MSFEVPDEVTADGRRAAHVKWDGKTIALGTFSAHEAVEKCNRAKALTKKWRTTMIPKPDVEWVKTTLERLNIRVVNDRPGRRKKRPISDVDLNTDRPSTSPAVKRGYNTSLLPANQNINMGNIGYDHAFQALNRRMNPYNMGTDTSRSVDRRSSDPTQYDMSPQDRNPAAHNVLAPLPNTGNIYNLGNAMSGYDTISNNYQQEQQMLSNVLRGDEPQRISQRSNTTQEQLSHLAFGSNQHYQVLKEHHMNLLKELQETTTLMSMYHNNAHYNFDNYGSNNLRNRNQDSFEPFSIDQSNLSMGSNNQMTYSSPESRSSSLGLGSVNVQMTGVQNLQNHQLDSQSTSAARRESLRNSGLLFTPLPLTASRYNHGGQGMINFKRE